MKKIILSFIMLFSAVVARACQACEIAQPRYLRGITHGSGPESNWDFLIIAFISTIVVFTLFFSVKWLIKPGEKSKSHIKHMVLNIE